MEGLFAQARKAELDMDALGEQLAARKEELTESFKASGMPKPELTTMDEVAGLSEDSPKFPAALELGAGDAAGRDHRLFRRGDQQRQLSRRRPGDAAPRRSSIRCSISIRASGTVDDAVGRRDPGRGGRAGACRSSWVLETHAACRPSVGGRRDLQGGPARRSASAPGIREVQQAFGPTVRADDLQVRRRRLRPAARGRRALAARRAEIEVIATPGHTPACVSYRIGDAVFVGDTLFMPDYGTARCDFPGGDARQLYRSIQRSSRCRPRRGCSCATITRRRAATSLRGRRRSARSATATFISAAESARRSMSRCARRATRH